MRHVNMRKEEKQGIFVLRNMAQDNRHLLSPWRAHLYLRKHVDSFFSEEQLRRLLRKLEKEAFIKPLYKRGKRALYQVTSPYARKDLNIFEVISEAYYPGIFCYVTAMEMHGLTDQRSYDRHLYVPRRVKQQVVQVQEKDEQQKWISYIPLGTQISDWRLTPLPPLIELAELDGYTIRAHYTKDTWLFGFEVVDVERVPVRRTDLERTLLDGLRFPKHCGGLNEVFRAWVRALDSISVDRLVGYTEQFNQLILFQRVGFVMETLGLEHERLAMWKKDKTARGGSRVLDPEQPYAPTYSEAWQLSLNHPIAILEQRDGSYS